jgi:hypothetical protein
VLPLLDRDELHQLNAHGRRLSHEVKNQTPDSIDTFVLKFRELGAKCKQWNTNPAAPTPPIADKIASWTSSR